MIRRGVWWDGYQWEGDHIRHCSGVDNIIDHSLTGNIEKGETNMADPKPVISDDEDDDVSLNIWVSSSFKFEYIYLYVIFSLWYFCFELS